MVAVALVISAVVAGRATAQPTTSATLRSFNSFEAVPVFDSLEHVTQYFDPHLGTSRRPTADTRNLAYGRGPTESPWGITAQEDGSAVTVLDSTTVPAWNSAYGQVWAIRIDHVILDDGRAAWVEAAYVF